MCILPWYIFNGIKGVARSAVVNWVVRLLAGEGGWVNSTTFPFSGFFSSVLHGGIFLPQFTRRFQKIFRLIFNVSYWYDQKAILAVLCGLHSTEFCFVSQSDLLPDKGKPVVRRGRPSPEGPVSRWLGTGNAAGPIFRSGIAGLPTGVSRSGRRSGESLRAVIQRAW